MKIFATIANPLAIFSKLSIIDVRGGPDYASDNQKNKQTYSFFLILWFQVALSFLLLNRYVSSH